MTNLNGQTTTKKLAQKSMVGTSVSLNRLSKQLGLCKKSTKNALDRAVAKGLITYETNGRMIHLSSTKLATILLG